MTKSRIATGVTAITVVGLVAWYLGWFGGDRYSSDPAVAELQELRDQQFAKSDQMSENQQQSAREDFRQRMEGLTENQRRAFFESSAPLFMKMFLRQIDRFLALSPEEQRAEMDRRIAEMQARGGPPGAGSQQPDPQQMDQMRKRMLDWTTPEDRAKFESFMTKFSDRMKERGINPGPGGGFF